MYISKYCIYNLKYGLNNWNYPSQSIIRFSKSSYELTIIDEIIVLYFTKLLSGFFIGGLIIVFSIFLKKTFMTFFLTTTIIIVPFLIFTDQIIKYSFPSPLALMFSERYFSGSGNEFIKQIPQTTYYNVVVVSILIIILLIILSYFKYSNIHLKFKNIVKVSNFALMMFLLVSFTGCSSSEKLLQDRIKNDNTIFNASDSDSVVLRNEKILINSYKYDSIEDVKVEELHSDISYNMYLDPFENESFHTIRINNNKIYYNKYNENLGNLYIIERDIDTLKERVIYEDILDVKSNHGFLKYEKWKDNGVNYPSSFFFVTNEHLYIVSKNYIYRIDLYSGKKEKIFDKELKSFSFYKGKFYYLNEEHFLMCYDTITGTSNKISEMLLSQLNITPNGIYFSNLSDRNKTYFMDYNGQHINKINDDSYFDFTYDEEYIYYIKTKDLMVYRMKINGENEELVIDKPCCRITTFKNCDTFYYVLFDQSDQPQYCKKNNFN